ncbi:MAG: DEAD/DEAH box helicase, partial [Gammaproteobacteria bacterium]
MNDPQQSSPAATGSGRRPRGRGNRADQAATAAKVDWHPDEFPVEPQAGMVRFQDLDLAPSLLHAIADLGFRYCSPIQARALPFALRGHDVVGKAQTGTGKT